VSPRGGISFSEAVFLFRQPFQVLASKKKLRDCFAALTIIKKGVKQSEIVAASPHLPKTPKNKDVTPIPPLTLPSSSKVSL